MQERAGQVDDAERARKFEIQDTEYVIPYHYQDVFGIGQSVGRNSIFEHLVSVITDCGGKNVLDVGCGDGRFCYYAAESLDVDGVDLSRRAIEWAKLFNPTLNFYLCDVGELKKTYDAGVCIEVIEHIPDDRMDLFLGAISKRIKRNGVLIFTVPSKLQPLYDKHFRHYDQRLLKQTLSPHFEVVEIIGHHRKSRLARLVFSILNLLSVASYSDSVKYRFRKQMEMLASVKKRFWRRYLHAGKTDECMRLIAVCKNSKR